MAKRQRTKIDSLVDQIIQSEVENRLAKMARQAKRRSIKESTKLREFLQLPYVKDDIVEAEVIEPEAAGSGDSEVKKNSE